MAKAIIPQIQGRPQIGIYQELLGEGGWRVSLWSIVRSFRPGVVRSGMVEVLAAELGAWKADSGFAAFPYAH